MSRLVEGGSESRGGPLEDRLPLVIVEESVGVRDTKGEPCKALVHLAVCTKGGRR